MEKQLGSKNASGSFPTLELETVAQGRGFRYVAGVDEAGRGPLAGPLVVAAVILGKDWNSGHLLNDSKKLSLQKREHFFELICSEAQAFKIVSISPQEIDSLNILQATMYGMYRCLAEIRPAPDFALIDGNHYPQTPVPGNAVIKGDTRSKSIAAASILAKVTRDRYMVEKAKLFPEWSFDLHKGYPTKLHRKAIEEYGLTPLHRKSFRLKPVQMELL